MQQLIKLIYTAVVELNLFPPRHFTSSVSRAQSKRLGQLATRLYMILLVIGLSILIFRTVFEPRILKETIDKPSLSAYNDLLVQHGETLECPCSNISLIHGRYVSVEPAFHQVIEAP